LVSIFVFTQSTTLVVVELRLDDAYFKLVFLVFIKVDLKSTLYVLDLTIINVVDFVNTTTRHASVGNPNSEKQGLD
jgi:hypothetical protein